jgi:hypothetical protein
MKRIFLLFTAFLLLSAVPSIAQKGFYFGIAGSGNSTWITNQNNYGLPEMDYTSTFAFGGNLGVGYDFTDHLGLKLELGLNQISEKYHDTQSSTELARQVKLNYFNIPILFRYRTGGKVAKFYVAVGPQFNMLRSATQTYTANGQPLSDSITKKTLSGTQFIVGAENIKDRYNSLDIVGRMDLGVNITVVEHLMIDVGLTMGYGLTDINASDYRIPDFPKEGATVGTYHPSHTIFGGLTVGISYHL